MKFVFLLCSVSSLYLQLCYSANIVAFIPFPFHSHQTAFKPLWLELARRGHKITLIQPDLVIENNENVTHILLSGTHDLLEKYKFVDKLSEGEPILKIMLSVLQCFDEGLQYQLTHPGIQELLKGGKKVDLFFAEFISTFGFSLGHKLNAPMIGLISMDASIDSHIFSGNPTHPIMYPDKDMPYTQPLKLQDRTMNALYWFSDRLLKTLVFSPLQEKLVGKYLGQNTPLEDIVKNISLLFINANPLFNVVRPLGPKTVNIGGGVHILNPKPLPLELQNYLDKAKNGVIYFSLGTIITSKQLANTTKDVILKTFSQLPYDILWKIDEDIQMKSDNVKVVKWLPQQDLLRHKNVKVFITQGGLQSMEEAIFSYVPMIALPFYGDQHNNADKMVARGFGLKLDHTKLDVETFKAAILEVLNNSTYRERTKELADLVMDQPMTGLEKAVWWTEYVLRHGHTDHFRNPSADIPWYQFLFLDVGLCLILVLVIATYLFIKALKVVKWLIYKLFRLFAKKPKAKTN